MWESQPSYSGSLFKNKHSMTCFCPCFVQFNFRAKLYTLYVTIGAERLHIWHPRGILNRNLFLGYPWPYINYANIYDNPKCFLYVVTILTANFFSFFYFYPAKKIMVTQYSPELWFISLPDKTLYPWFHTVSYLDIHKPVLLADPGEARGCSTNSLIIHWFIDSLSQSAFSSHSFTVPPCPNV